MYMGIDQVPVSVQDKTYYACCDQCIRDLNNDQSVRYAIDPYSKVRVDKAFAFITMNPEKKGAILYFESANNAKKYLDK
jgi:YHS domain-containing protein